VELRPFHAKATNKEKTDLERGGGTEEWKEEKRWKKRYAALARTRREEEKNETFKTIRGENIKSKKNRKKRETPNGKKCGMLEFGPLGVKGGRRENLSRDRLLVKKHWLRKERGRQKKG